MTLNLPTNSLKLKSIEVFVDSGLVWPIFWGLAAYSGLGDGTGFWNMNNGPQRAELIRDAQLIVFDEAPMAHRFIFEIMDRFLRDIFNSNAPFGNKTILSFGSFRQITPVVAKARIPGDIASVSLRASHLWPYFKLFSL
jgi:hypothetical protein